MKTMSAPDKTAETEAEASTKDKASFGVVRLLMPYLWPKDRPSFKLRIASGHHLPGAGEGFERLCPIVFQRRN